MISKKSILSTLINKDDEENIALRIFLALVTQQKLAVVFLRTGIQATGSSTPIFIPLEPPSITKIQGILEKLIENISLPDRVTLSLSPLTTAKKQSYSGARMLTKLSFFSNDQTNSSSQRHSRKRPANEPQSTKDEESDGEDSCTPPAAKAARSK